MARTRRQVERHPGVIENKPVTHPTLGDVIDVARDILGHAEMGRQDIEWLGRYVEFRRQCERQSTTEEHAASLVLMAWALICDGHMDPRWTSAITQFRCDMVSAIQSTSWWSG